MRYESLVLYLSLSLSESWEVRSSPSGVPTLYFTIITVPAHESFSAVHDRMPAVIPHDLIDVWLGDDLGLALSLLVPRGELDWYALVVCCLASWALFFIFLSQVPCQQPRQFHGERLGEAPRPS